MTEVGAINSELIAMVRHICGGRKPIHQSAAIVQDLQIDGDDAYELLENISKRFGTSFKGLDWLTYFHNETDCGPISYWLGKLGFQDNSRKAITVGHLLAVIERGAWFEPQTSN